MTPASSIPSPTSLPLVIQGGMGVGVSTWRLARAVARRGQLGVVSGTALNTVLIRRLQDGDSGGHVRHAVLLRRTPIRTGRLAKSMIWIKAGADVRCDTPA